MTLPVSLAGRRGVAASAWVPQWREFSAAAGGRTSALHWQVGGGPGVGWPPPAATRNLKVRCAPGGAPRVVFQHPARAEGLLVAWGREFAYEEPGRRGLGPRFQLFGS